MLNKTLKNPHLLQELQSLPVSNCMGMTAPPTLYWNMLKWNFDVERVDVRLGRNVQYTGSMSRLPTLVLERSKGRQLEGGHANRKRNLAFSGGNHDEIGWNFHGGIWTPWPTISSGIHSPGPPALWASMQNPCVRVERLLCSVKLQKESNRVTTWHANKPHRRQLENLVHSLLVSATKSFSGTDF